ncbi:MAG TPA: hypothetical protein VE910_03880 [Dongiaceae bacterium]|nr:hypothetical protein [Dongiaceae bacterium]
MRLGLVLLVFLFSSKAVLSAEAPGPTSDAKLIRSIAEGADHPIVFTGVVRSRTAKNETTDPYWLLKIGSVKMLTGTPRQTVSVAVPCVFYFQPGFQRVTSHFSPVYPAYSEQPQIFYPGDRVFMIAQFQGTSTSDPKGHWTTILTRYFNDDTGRLFSQEGFYLNGAVADSLAYINQAVPPDTSFCRRIMQPSETTIAEVKSVLVELAATPAKKTP